MLTKSLKKENEIVVAEARIAHSFFERFLGLMGKTNLTLKDSIVFPNCNSVHTLFMRENIDVIFVSAQGLVVKIFDSLKPWKMLLPQKHAAHCIELPSKESKRLGIREGDSLVCEGIFG